MIAAMKEEKPFCNQAQALGITHIVVRQDIDLANPIEDKPADIINVLNSSPEVEMPTMFSSNTSKGITIYPLKDNCTIKNMVSLNGSNRNVSYNMVNPVKYEIEVSQIKNGDTLELLNNFHYGWKIYGNNNLMQSYDNKNTYRPHNLFEDLGDVRLLFNESYNEANHKVTRDYANGWKIDINELAKVSEVKENNDGTYTIRVIAYYNLQNYFYIGLIIFVTISILIVSYMLYSYSVKKSHHKKNDKIDSYNR